MDRIITLSAGRIVESGSPRELLRAGGAFAAMASLQGIQAD
jgi:ABC-type multidrug transport system fused ATPase/permease subunit